MSNRSFTKSTRTFIFFPWLDINLKLSKKPQFLYRLVPYTKSLVLNALQNEYHNEYHFWNIFDVILVVKDVSEVKAKKTSKQSPRKLNRKKLIFFSIHLLFEKKLQKMFMSSELRVSLICRSGEVFHSLSFSSSPWFCNEKKNLRLVSQTKLKDRLPH